MEVDFCEIALGCGYKYAIKVKSKIELEREIKKVFNFSIKRGINSFNI